MEIIFIIPLALGLLAVELIDWAYYKIKRK